MPRHFLKEALLPDGVKAVRLVFSDPPYFNPDVVEDVINELSAKEFLVRAGLDSFTAVDKLMYRMLYESAVASGRLPEWQEKSKQVP